MINKENLLNALEYHQNLTHEEIDYLKGLVSEETACEICGQFAGFETGPEGEYCTECNQWVCSIHVDWSFMAAQKTENVICTECSL